MPIPLYHIDAFTHQPFRGNPAAVCILDRPRDDRWLAGLAAEMNLSETAFLLRESDGWRLRWFTPAVEVKLCGHATLASAHVLWQAGRLAPAAEARFHTLSGLLTARRAGDWIEMDFPVHGTQPGEPPAALLAALGVRPVSVHRADWVWLIELSDESAVRAVAPDFAALKPLRERALVTARSADPAFDIVCRFFDPADGIDEDPVTGSAHCVLSPFWSARLGKRDLVSHQISARGGVVKMRLDADRVKLSGQAVTIFQGELSADAAG